MNKFGYKKIRAFVTKVPGRRSGSTHRGAGAPHRPCPVTVHTTTTHSRHGSVPLSGFWFAFVQTRCLYNMPIYPECQWVYRIYLTFSAKKSLCVCGWCTNAEGCVLLQGGSLSPLRGVEDAAPYKHRFPIQKRALPLRTAPLVLLFRARNYFSILETTPEPTVWPPSRIAKRRPSSMATGVISSTCISTLSPGMHISVPSGRVMMPVTSVVRK